MASRHSVFHFTTQQIGMANELGGVGGGRAAVNFSRGRHLLQFALAQQGDAVRHDHGFFLIMGDKYERDSDFALQRFQFYLHLAAKVGVQRGEWLVEEQQARAVYQRTGESDTLLLSATDFRRFGTGVSSHLDHIQRLFDPGCDFLFGQPGDLQSVANIFRDREVREQRVVLEYGVNPAPVGRQVVEAFAAHQNLARARALESGDDAQQRSFPRTAFAEDGEKFAFGNLQRDVTQYVIFPERFGDVADGEQRERRLGSNR